MSQKSEQIVLEMFSVLYLCVLRHKTRLSHCRKEKFLFRFQAENMIERKRALESSEII